MDTQIFKLVQDSVTSYFIDDNDELYVPMNQISNLVMNFHEFAIYGGSISFDKVIKALLPRTNDYVFYVRVNFLM